MTWGVMLTIYAGLLTVLIAFGVPIAAAMGLVGIVGITLLSGTQLWPSIADVIWNTANSFTLTGGGALGNLIPPSIFLLVYATVVQQSPIDLFVATVIPGAIAVAMFMGYVLARVLIDPSLVPARQPHHSWPEIGVAVLQVLPVTTLMVAIIGGMYFGVVTPTEAAGFGCLLSLVLALLYRELTYDTLWAALINSIAVTCVMSLIVINGQLLGFAIVQAGIGRGVSQALASSGMSPFVFFVVIFFLYLALGAALDGISMMLLTVPVLYPTLKALGFDDIWFGVILVIQAELSQLSPPIGLNLFAVQSIARDVDMATISWASLPYAVMLSLLCFLLFFFPELATWLPMAMRR